MSERLGAACRAGDAELVAELVRAGHIVDEPLDEVGTTPLMVASTVDVVDVLLSAGASLDLTRFGQDALQVVVSDDDSAVEAVDERLVVARRLIAGGATIGQRDGNGMSRLYRAAFHHDVGAVEALVELGADPDDDPAPLAAVCWGSGDDSNATSRIIDVLVDAGADVNRRDAVGWSLIHGAAMPYSHGVGFASSDGANVEAIKALVRHGVAPDMGGPDGVTALMLVSADGDLEAVESLLALGADPNVRDDQGMRAMEHAQTSEQGLTEVLRTARADTKKTVRQSRRNVRECIARLSER